MITLKEVRICLDEYVLRYSPARDASICGYRELTDLSYAQTAVVRIGINLELEGGKADNDLVPVHRKISLEYFFHKHLPKLD